jgi:hypothetical protein
MQCCYIVGKVGFQSSDGRMMYILYASATELQLNMMMPSFVKYLFSSPSIDSVMLSLPPVLNQKTTEIFRTRWPFFHKIRQFILTKNNPPMGFPTTTLIKTPFQFLYNAMKGGLDSNTQ